MPVHIGEITRKNYDFLMICLGKKIILRIKQDMTPNFINLVTYVLYSGVEFQSITHKQMQDKNGIKSQTIDLAH